jgi:hypothetical protein
MNEHVERIIQMAQRLEYECPVAVAEEIAAWAERRVDDPTEWATVSLVQWIGQHMGDHLNLKNPDDWPAIVRAAELMAMAMLAQHRVDQAATNRAVA